MLTRLPVEFAVSNWLTMTAAVFRITRITPGLPDCSGFGVAVNSTSRLTRCTRLGNEKAPTIRRLRRLDPFGSVGAKFTGAIVIGEINRSDIRFCQISLDDFDKWIILLEMTENAKRCKIYRAHRAKLGLCIWACGKKATHGCGLCDDCFKSQKEKCYARNTPKYRRTGRHINGAWVRVKQ